MQLDHHQRSPPRRLIYEAFQEQGVQCAKRLIGGGARIRLWKSIFAEVLETPTARLNFIEEATSVGAAIAGGVGVGLCSSIRDLFPLLAGC